jgi:hypothetical protein
MLVLSLFPGAGLLEAIVGLEATELFGTVTRQQKKPDRPRLELLKQKMHALNGRGVA